MSTFFFNPLAQDEAAFVDSFVARHETLAYFLRQIQLCPPDQAARHHLIVAPRGYGKTALLRRIAIAVRQDAELAGRFLPLTFREEQYNVISLDVFWRNCLQSLLEAREDAGAPAAEVEQLEAAWERHAPRQALDRDDQDGQPAWREFHARCQQLGRRPLLLIDNLDALLAGLPPRHEWALRGTLQGDDGPMLIAAAPRFPDSTHDPKAAFYEFFRPEVLDKLSDQEVMRCLRALATRRGATGEAVLTVLDQNPGRIAALNALAGGNPRTLSVLYVVLESKLNADVLAQLGAMLDTFTSWYQARTEELPMQARAVFDALALNWDPMTAAAVGAATGLDTPAASSQIARLEKFGLVEAVALSRRGQGRNGYQLAERFFNIWYLMRNGPRRARQSVKFLAVFLETCFSSAERRTLARTVLTEGSSNPAYMLGLAESLRPSRLRSELLDRATELASRSGEAAEYGAVASALRGVEATPSGDAAVESRWQEARALFAKGCELAELGRASEAMEAFDSVIDRFGDAPEAPLRDTVARSLFNRGVALEQLGRPEEAVDAYDGVAVRFGEAPEAPLRESVVAALVNKGAVLGDLGRVEKALEAFDRVVGRFPEAPLRETVAAALFNKGLALDKLGLAERAVEAYDAMVGHLSEASSVPLREAVATALGRKGLALCQLGRAEQAIETYDDVFNRFGEASEAPLRQLVAKALFHKGAALAQLGRPEQAIGAYNAVIDRFGEDSDASVREVVAKAFVNKGTVLGPLGHTEQEIAVYNDVLSRFGGASEAHVREAVAGALVNKGIALQRMGRHAEAVDALRTAAPGAPATMALTAWNILGNLLLDHLGDPVEACTAYEAGLTKGGAPTDRAFLHANCAYALALFGADLPGALRHQQEALADETSLSPAGRHLLGALSCLAEPRATRWARLFEAIGHAVECHDEGLWGAYLDDLQRLLWFVIAQGEGASLRRWMDDAQYPHRFAPLYHAIVAAIDGDDHLLRINPEVRQAAAGIHAGIARLLALYSRKAREPKKRPKSRRRR